MTGELPSSIIADISFVGRGGGQIKTLSGFKKGHHTLPDVANATTTAFLGKICGAELTEEAEQLFQTVRAGLGYKRKDVTLTVTSPFAVLTAKDFVLEMLYALDETEPARYLTTTTLARLRNVELARTEEFSDVFGGRFSELSFAFKQTARIEAIIDAVEAIDEDAGMAVAYPSNYAECEIRVNGVDARVRCTSSALNIVFPRAGAPRDLIEGFASVCDAFSISKVLAGLIR